MLYLITSRQVDTDIKLREQAHPAHLARLEALKKSGRLLAAGSLPAIDSENPGPAGFTGTVVIAEFDSLEAARHWAETDPYVSHGVFTDAQVNPYLNVLP